MDRKSWFCVVCAICVAVSGWYVYDTKQENQRYQLANIINTAEIRVLYGEVFNSDQKIRTTPTYEEGYRDAVIRIGRPAMPGAYQDGWDAAMKVVGDGDYATGYHNAIKQFGYEQSQYSRHVEPNRSPPTVDVKK